MAGKVRCEHFHQTAFSFGQCHLVQGIRISGEFDKFLEFVRNGYAIFLEILHSLGNRLALEQKRRFAFFEEIALNRLVKIGISGPA